MEEAHPECSRTHQHGGRVIFLKDGIAKVTIRPVFNGTVPLLSYLSRCPDNSFRDAQMSRFGVSLLEVVKRQNGTLAFTVSYVRCNKTNGKANSNRNKQQQKKNVSLCLVAMVVMHYTARECQCWTVTVKAITQLLHCLKLNVLVWLSNWACWTYWLTVKLFLAVLVLTFSSRICQPCRRLEWTRRIQRLITFNDKQHSAVKLNQAIYWHTNVFSYNNPYNCIIAQAWLS